MNRTQALPRPVAAARYRQREQLTGGVVILNQGFPTGWHESMPAPSEWTPGVTAVDENGTEWIALGGNETDGATTWRQLNG